MGTRIENQCCDCAAPGYPCMGEICPLRRVKVHYCDRCDVDLDVVYWVDGEELCEDCLKELFKREDE